MPVQLPQSFKLREGRDQLEACLKNKLNKKDVLSDLLLLTDNITDKSLDISIEDLQTLGNAVSAIEPFNIERLSKVQQEQFINVKNNLKQNWQDVDDEAVASFLRIMVIILEKSKLSDKQVKSFTSSGPAKFWIALTLGISLATLPASIFNIIAGNSLAQVSAWRAAAAAVMSTGLGTAIAAFFKVRTTADKRERRIRAANAKNALHTEYNDALYDDNMKNALAAIKTHIERQLNNPQLTDTERASLQNDLTTCQETIVDKLPDLCTRIKGRYPELNAVLTKLETHYNLQDQELDEVKKREEAHNTHGYQVWKYMTPGSGLFTGINATWLFVTVFGSFWGIAKAGIIAGGLGAFLSGPAFPFVAAAIGAILVTALVAVTIYTVFKKWRYDAEQKAVDAQVKIANEMAENQASLQKEIKELSHEHTVAEHSSLQAVNYNTLMNHYQEVEELLSKAQSKLFKADLHNEELDGKIRELIEDFREFKKDIVALKKPLDAANTSVQEINQKFIDFKKRRLEFLDELSQAKEGIASEPALDTASQQRPSSSA